MTQIFDKLIPDQQHGFRSHRSTVTNLLAVTQFYHYQINNKNQVDCITFDLSKAFDVINHFKLAIELASYSTPFTLYKVFMNYVINRIYQLLLDGQPTDCFINSNKGVPQGSHSGPLAFLIYVIKVFNITNGTNFNIEGYADDFKLYGVVNNDTDRANLQKMIDLFVEWMTDMGLKINISKTFVITYHKTNIKFESHYFIGMELIQRVNQLKDLGVTFDDRLTFKQHIANILLNIDRMSASAYRFCKEIGSMKLFIRIAKIYIIPITEYASPIVSR